MALELKIAVFAGFLAGGVDVGDGDAAFHAAAGEAGLVVEAFDLLVSETRKHGKELFRKCLGWGRGGLGIEGILKYFVWAAP